MTAQLKPAKGKEDQYTVGSFPVSLLCHPYKYDLKLIGELTNNGATTTSTADNKASSSKITSITELLNQQRSGSANNSNNNNNASQQQTKEESDVLSLLLLDADTYDVPVIQLDDDHHLQFSQPLVLKKKEFVTVESVTHVSNNERIIRFVFNLCSFHVKKRAFRLVVVNKASGEHLFVSTPFKTFARRRDTQSSSSASSLSSSKNSFQHALRSANHLYFAQHQQARASGGLLPTMGGVVNNNNNGTTTSAKMPKRPTTHRRFMANTPYAAPTVATAAASVANNKRSASAAAHFQQQQQQHMEAQPMMGSMPVMYAPSGVSTASMFVPMYHHQAAATSAAPCYAYPMEAMLQNLGSQERTSLAIQLMSSLSPLERQTVDFYLNCSEQCQYSMPATSTNTTVMNKATKYQV